MPHKTDIEWCDFSSNCLRARTADGKTGWACAKVSAGCQQCYSETLNRRFGTKLDFSKKSVREVEHYIDEKELRHILKFRPKPPFKNGRSRPSVFPFDMTDLFGEWNSDATIDRIFAAFALRPDVDFLALTKRPERASEYFSASDWTARVLDNLWLGTSVENQQQADLRIPHLLRCPARVRFLSVEPMLSAVDLLHDNGLDGWDYIRGWNPDAGPEGANTSQVSWVICGAESGPGARPMHDDWARDLRDQCRAANVAFFLKQRCDSRGRKIPFADWPDDLRVRELPN